MVESPRGVHRGVSVLIGVVLMLGGASLAAQQREAEDGHAVTPTSDDAARTAADDVRPRLDEIFRPPRLLGVRPRDASLSADGRWLTWRWTSEDAEKPERDLWIGRSDGSEARVLFAHDVAVEVRWALTGATLLVQRDGWLHRLDPDLGETLVPLIETGPRSQLELLEDGRRALVVAGPRNQLWVLDLADGRRITPAASLRDRSGRITLLEHEGLVALFARAPAQDDADTPRDAATPGAAKTKDATPTDTSKAPVEPRALYLVDLDGVRPPRRLAVEEDETQTLVSPTGRWIVRRSTQVESTRELILANYLTEAVTTVSVRDSLPGDDASPVTLEFVETGTGRELSLELGGNDRFYLLRLEWSPTDDLLLAERLSNDFHVREVLLADPASGEVRALLSERDEAWIGGPLRWTRFSDDGRSVLFTSERSGFEHLYATPVGGGPARALTRGRFELRALLAVPHSGRLLAVATTPDDPSVHRLLAVDADAASATPLTGMDGCASSLRVSADGSTVAYEWETLGVPGDLHVLRFAEPRVPSDDEHEVERDGAGDLTPPLLDDAKPVRITDSVPAAYTDLGLPPPEIVEYVTPGDDVTVRAFLYRPAGDDDDTRHPAVIFIHGAGSLQNVTRSMSEYAVNMLFHQRLAQKGYVVLDVDYRHSYGYGRDFRAAIHGFMGGKDLDDVVAGVDYLGSLGIVDTSRVGVYGGSYGGFLTLMALFTRPEVFACGAALRSVTDWRTYNHWYTNSRLGDPERDAEAYARSSPIDHAAGLAKPLLLLHGLQDDNVFAQDTIRLMETLIQLGKDFDVMLYPSQKHGFDDPESWIDEYKRIERLFDETLHP